MRAAVLGSPIEHSLSPTLHTAAYAALGLEDRWHYERFECDEDGLARFLDGCDASWAGLSLTMPLKRVAMALADDLAEPVTEVGGANTIVFQDGRRHAYNTDVAGIVRALGEAGISRVDSATVVGGGATAASALAALRALGATEPGAITVLARDPARAAPVAEAAARMGLRIGVEPLRDIKSHLDTDLVASTVPRGAADPYTAELVASRAALFDVSYGPEPSVPADAVAAAGRTVVEGFPMLLHQAGRQVELMTGVAQAPIEVMRAAGEAELRRRTGAG
ncbi:shikimate dehydrogenase [Lipingzhangella halophila]|uniref:Shikimate dehydrogenase n=1 Tax=Lipingzhangella halophila TaxID=1783352 RepID=A0A7W7W495_9ACTN|nr:shikimate dehydrogenase [Lipingzhangella halophila]MBB4932505.1 shikimate dehydrogenase [Lipingzhangella halophila]